MDASHPQDAVFLKKQSFIRTVSSISAGRMDELPRSSLLLSLIPLTILAWLIQRSLLPLLSSWLPLVLAAWVSFQYRRFKHNTVLMDLNKRWKRHILYTSPKTPLEPCEWVNLLMKNLWPGYVERRLSHILSETMRKRFKEKRPHIFRDIELHELFLGTRPPSLGLQRIYWSTESNEEVLHMGFEWDTTDVRILLAAKLAGPFGGMARLIINCLYIKGELRISPILDGQAFVYSFASSPEVRIGLAFGGGGQSLPATELPPVASWLERLFLETITRTMVAPERRCFPLAAVSMKKRVTGGVLCVTVLSAENVSIETARMSFDRRSYANSFSISNGRTHENGSGHGSSKKNSNGSGSQQSLSSMKITTFVELTLEGLRRSTQVVSHTGSPAWNESFNMILHESVGTISFNIYGQSSKNVKYDFLGSCEVKVIYVDDGSTIFWTCGENGRVLADRAEGCGKEITMEIPIINSLADGSSDSKFFVKLLMKEWQFKDGSRTGATLNSSRSSQSSARNVRRSTGRTLRITIVEGRDLAAKDKTGKSDPYVRLQYGKVVHKTKTVKQDLNPVWSQTFEVRELENEERLHLRCYDADYLNDENLGSARVSVAALEDGVPRDVWVPLEKIHTGEIRLIVEAFYAEPESEQIQYASNEDHINPKGLIEVMILEARDLVAADLRGTSDPFVCLNYGDEKRTTKVIQKTLNPQWNEKFEFIDTSKPLVVHVKDHNELLPDTSIGKCEIEYRWLARNKMDKWIPLQGVKKGEIHVQVTRLQPAIKNTESTKDSSKVKGLLQEMQDQNITSVDNDMIRKKIEKIEILEQEKCYQLNELLREKELLLKKVKELEGILNETFEVREQVGIAAGISFDHFPLICDIETT